MKITFFTAGGTIDKVYFDALSHYEVGPSNIKTILKNARVTFDFSIHSLLKKDSLDMTDDDRRKIYKRVLAEDNDKIIITHGTDTMIETARALQKIKNKVIVMTGAMEPAAFKSSDAVFNLGLAVSAVQTLSCGIYIAMSGRIFHADKTEKNHQQQRFEENL